MIPLNKLNGVLYMIMYKKADITDRQKAMLDFAIKTCNRSQDINEDDFAILYQHGFSDDDIWDIGAITGLFALSNRMATNLTISSNALASMILAALLARAMYLTKTTPQRSSRR